MLHGVSNDDNYDDDDDDNNNNTTCHLRTGTEQTPETSFTSKADTIIVHF